MLMCFGCRSSRLITPLLIALVILMMTPILGIAQGGEAHLVLPDLDQGSFLGTSGRTLLMSGLGICALGLLFGLMTYKQLRDLPVHPSMREVSELIWETCKTYLFTQGK